MRAASVKKRERKWRDSRSVWEQGQRSPCVTEQSLSNSSFCIMLWGRLASVLSSAGGGWELGDVSMHGRKGLVQMLLLRLYARPPPSAQRVWIGAPSVFTRISKISKSPSSAFITHPPNPMFCLFCLFLLHLISLLLLYDSSTRFSLYVPLRTNRLLSQDGRECTKLRHHLCFENKAGNTSGMLIHSGRVWRDGRWGKWKKKKHWLILLCPLFLFNIKVKGPGISSQLKN